MPSTFSIKPIPFVEAIQEAHARGVVLPAAYYGELQGLARQLSFSIAGVTSLSQLESVRDSLTEHMVAGGTFREWKEQVRGGKVGLTLPSHRLDNIFRTNLQGNYMRGRCEAVQTHAAALPYLVYSAVNDSRTRPAHAAMHGYVAAVTDKVWQTWMPPNGYRCRCTVIQVSATQAARWATRDAVRVSRPGAADERLEALSTGPDPGWDYTVCKEPDRGVLETMQEAGVKLQPALAEKLTKLKAGAKEAELAALKEAVHALNTELAKEMGKEELDRAIVAANARAAELAAKAKAAELPFDMRTPLSMDRFRWTAPKKGSNEGGFYDDIHTGKKWYIKFPRTELHARNEVLAARLYRLAGVEVPDLRFVRHSDGRLGVASPIIEGAIEDEIALKSGLLTGVNEGFTADAWLANWDVVGTGYDNMLVVGGRAVRIDTGGALLFRAQGEAKGIAFGDVVTELDSLKDKKINSYAASVFKKTTRAQIKAGAKRILTITDEQIDLVVEGYLKGGAAEHEILHIAETLKKRRDFLKKTLEPAAKKARAPRLKPGDEYFPISASAVRRALRGRYSEYAEIGKDYVAPFNVPVHEKAALTGYTGSNFREWNRYLRGENVWSQAEKEDSAEAIKAAVNALNRLPAYAGDPLKRRQNAYDIPDIDRWIEAHKTPGNVLLYRGFTSSSYGGRAAFSGDIEIMIRQHSTGRQIDRVSAFGSEREVLFQPGTTFRVISYFDDGSTKFVVLDEVDSSNWDYTFSMDKKYPDMSMLTKARAARVKKAWDRGFELEEKADAAFMGRGPKLTPEELEEYLTFRRSAELVEGGFEVVQTPEDPPR